MTQTDIIRILWKSALTIMIGILVTGCESIATMSTLATEGDQTVTAEEVGFEEAPNVRQAYQLGSGDQVRIIIFGEEDLSGEFFLDGEGNVSLPLIGEINAAGLTISQFRSEVQERLSDGYLNDPRVSAEVLSFRPFYILGEVEISGEYPYSDGMTVMNAIARAGGFTYRANTRVVYIKRANTDVEVEVPLTATLRVMPGDTIRVAERFF